MGSSSDKSLPVVELSSQKPDNYIKVKSERGSQFLNKDVDETISTVKRREHTNQIPFGLNRWVVLVLYAVLCFFAGPAYFSWAALRGMLVADGAYKWLCDLLQNDKDAPDFFDPEKNTCVNMSNAIKLLFTIGVTFHFVASAAFGLILDSLGPKITGLCGISLQILGWILLGSGSYNFRSYIPGMMIMCMGIDASFFPCLSLGNLFPKNMATIIAVLGAARSASFYIIFVLEKVVIHVESAKFSTTVYSFVGLCLGFCLLVIIILVPWKPFVIAEDAETVTCIDVPNADHSHKESPETFIAVENSVPTVTRNDSDDSRASRRKSDTFVSGSKCSEPLETDSSTDRGRQRHFGDVASTSVADMDLGVNEMSTKPAAEADKMSRKDRLYDFWNDVKSIQYIPLLILFVITLQRVLYFGQATDDLLIDDVLEFYKIVSPLSFIPCPVMGWLGDVIGILPVMAITNTAGTLMIAFSIIPGIPAATVCQYLAVVTYCIHVSFLLSQVYCYITATFHPRNMGKLIGLVCAVAGLMALVTISMYEHSTRHGHSAMMIMILVESGVVFVLLGVLWYAKRKPPPKTSGKPPPKTSGKPPREISGTTS